MKVLSRLHQSFDSEVIFQPQKSSAVSGAFLEVRKTAEFKSCMTSLCHLSRCSYGDWPLIGSLSNHDDDSNKNPTNLHIWQWKTVFLHALHVHVSFFDILRTFWFFLRREMTCLAVDKCSILYYYVPSTGSKLIPGQLEDIFQVYLTLNNWKMIAEARSYIFRWRSRFRRRRVFLSSLIADEGLE